MIIPRMHDCCTMFMGSKEAWCNAFGKNPSTRWCSNGYYERSMFLNEGPLAELNSYKSTEEYQQLLEQYGEDNADYVWEMMHPPIEMNETIYVELEGYEKSNSLEAFREYITAQDKELKVIQGSTEMMRKLMDGEWDSNIFLTVQPGQEIRALYDREKVIVCDC